MTIKISAKQRDALYKCFRERLTGIGDIELAIDSGNFDRAERLSREFSDDLRFVLDGLGFGDGGQGEVELTSPRDVLVRVLRRYQERAEGADRAEAEAREAAQKQHERDQLVSETCRELLSEVDKC